MQDSHSFMKAWGGNLHSAKGPGGQSQGVPGELSVGFSESREGAWGPEGGAKGSRGTPCQDPLSYQP